MSVVMGVKHNKLFIITFLQSLRKFFTSLIVLPQFCKLNPHREKQLDPDPLKMNDLLVVPTLRSGPFLGDKNAGTVSCNKKCGIIEK